MIHYRNQEEIECIRNSSLLVGRTLAEVAKNIRAGIETLSLDKIAEEFIRAHGAVPAFKNYKAKFSAEPYPFSLCVSVNEEVVHGIPSAKKILREGDIVAVDCGVKCNGFYGDSAYTFAVGEVNDEKKKLMHVTRESLMKGVAEAVAGKRLGDIGYAVQEHVEANGFSVVRELVGHGIGRELHEQPEVPNYGKRGSGMKLHEGLVIAIEPMVNYGLREVATAKDGWTVFARDRKPSAHYEHTVVVRKNQAEVLSTFKFIEEVIKN